MEFVRPITHNLPSPERFNLYFKSLSHAMESKHDWQHLYTPSYNRRGCRLKPRRNVGSIWNLLNGLCCYRAWFPARNTLVTAGLQIEQEHSQALLDELRELKAEIESDFGGVLDWSQRLCRNPEKQQRKFIFVSRHGSIQSPVHELQEIGEWHIDTLLKLDKAFTPRIEAYNS